MLKSISTSLILRGVPALLVGILALAWPGATVYALLILFAVFCFTDAVLQGIRGFTGIKAGPAVGHLLLGLIDIAAGVVAIVWPVPTALVLVLIAGIWAVAGGFFEIFTAFGHGLTAGTRALDILTGLLLIAFGVVVFARPGIGAVTFALLFGLFNLVFGTNQIIRGVEVRRLSEAVHAVGARHAHAA